METERKHLKNLLIVVLNPLESMLDKSRDLRSWSRYGTLLTAFDKYTCMVFFHIVNLFPHLKLLFIEHRL